MSTMASQITGVSIIYWTVCSGSDQRKHHRSVSLAFVRGIHLWPVNSPHKGPVKQKMFPFDDVIMSMYTQLPQYQLYTITLQHTSTSVPVWSCLGILQGHQLRPILGTSIVSSPSHEAWRFELSSLTWHWTKPITHLPLDKMAAISQTIFSDTFSWMKSFVYWLKFTEVCS